MSCKTASYILFLPHKWLVEEIDDKAQSFYSLKTVNSERAASLMVNSSDEAVDSCCSVLALITREISFK